MYQRKTCKNYIEISLLSYVSKIFARVNLAQTTYPPSTIYPKIKWASMLRD